MNRDFRIVFVCVVIGTTLAATALAPNAGSLHKVEPLWVDGAPGAKGNEDGDRPTLTIYLPPDEKAYISTTTFSYCEFGEPPNSNDAHTQTITSGVSEELFTWADEGASSLVPTYTNCKVRGGLSGSGQNSLDGPYHDYSGYKPSGSGNSDF